MARPATAARRYAEAVFDLAERDGAHDAWLGGLELAATVVGDPRVARQVDNPARPFAERRETLDRLLAARVSPAVLNLVRLLASRGRLDRLGAVAVEYKRLLDRDRGIVAAFVTSALPLDAAETAALRARVEAMTGATVDLRTSVDPAMIGGLTVRVGDTLLDASVRGRLERLRQQLISGTR